MATILVASILSQIDRVDAQFIEPTPDSKPLSLAGEPSDGTSIQDSLPPGGGMAIEVPPGEPRSKSRFRLRGRIDADAIGTSQSAGNRATFGDLHDIVGLRRARIGGEGEFGESGRYVAEIDLASGSVIPRDIFFGLGETAECERKLGHFREPFSLEGGTSANTFAFLERSPINALDPARNWGIELVHVRPDESSTLAVGIFHAGTGAGGFQSGNGSTVGLTGRLTAAPINEDGGARLMHFGVAMSGRVAEQGVIVVNQRARSPLIDFVDSSTSPFEPRISIPANFQQLMNLQFALANGPYWTQAEWYGTLIDQRGGPAVFFHGFHADCGYFISGEHRKYLGNGGVFGPVRVNRPVITRFTKEEHSAGWGAWEVTARFAFLDFFDSHAPTGTDGNLVGVTLPQATLGVNWYLADHLRVMFNYTYALPNEPNTGTTAANVLSSRLAIFG